MGVGVEIGGILLENIACRRKRKDGARVLGVQPVSTLGATTTTMSLTLATRWPVTIDSNTPLPHNRRGLRQLRAQ